MREHRVIVREVEDQDSEDFTLNHSLGGACRSTNHRYDLNCGHDSSMRTPNLCWVRERPISLAV